MGFQDMPEVVHLAASRKGGKIRTVKGVAAMSPEKRREVQSMGGRASGNKSKKGAKQTQEAESGDIPVLEAILGNIDEEVQE